METNTNLCIKGSSSFIGEVTDIEEWAKNNQIPNIKRPGQSLNGEDIQKILGIKGKSWNPSLFSNPDIVEQTAKSALNMACMSPSDIDAFILVTCTPFEVMFDRDAMYFMSKLQLNDHIIPIQLNAGCAGFARAFNLASRLKAKNTLILTYHLMSPVSDNKKETYFNNDRHPFHKHLWMTPALFSDGIGAVILSQSDQKSFSFYSRDSMSRATNGEKFDSPLVHYLGGGVKKIDGYKDTDLQCFAMEGEEIKKYYMEGMSFNHQSFLNHNPHYLKNVKKKYIHQASPNLVNAYIENFIKNNNVSRDLVRTQVEELGNIVTPSTIKLLDEDIRSGKLTNGDEICFSVVGAGPERGGFITRVSI